MWLHVLYSATGCNIHVEGHMVELVYNFANNVEVQSTIGKKMAAVHFTTVPCEPNTACKAQRKPNFYNICLCTKDIVYARFEDFVTLLCVFMNVVKAFPH